MTRKISTLHVLIELLDTNEVVLQRITSKAIDGSLSVDKERDVQREFTVTLDNRDGALTWSPDGTVWLDKRVRFSVGFATPDGIEYVPQGVFLLSQPSARSRYDGAHTATLAGGDKWRLHDGDPLGKFAATTKIAKGTLISDAIRTLAQDDGESKFAFDACDVVVPYDLTYNVGEPRGKAMKELADLAVYSLYYDVNGFLRFRPRNQNLALTASVWTYDVDDDFTLYAGGEKSLDTSKTFNRIVVIGDKVSAVAEITDVNSPLHKTKIGVRQFEWNGGSPDMLITTAELAQARADWELIKASNVVETQAFDTLPVYTHEAEDVVTIRDKYTATDDKYELTRFNIPLKPGEYMQAQATRVRKVG